MSVPRLDILLYCHDGRGIGHASRSVAIGMALRRLYPTRKVLLVSGSPYIESLRINSPLDWLKLPGYETMVETGKSSGIQGKSNFSDQELGQLRSQSLADLVRLYRPKVILSDHTPQGKHKELLPALEASQSSQTKWLLGVRGVIGNVRQIQGSLPQKIFHRYYKHILWYGDQQVLGPEHLRQLEQGYHTEATAMGYVSRMREVALCPQKDANFNRTPYAGVIALPWLDDHGEQVLDSLYQAMLKIGSQYGQWLFFHPVMGDNPQLAQIFRTLRSLAHVTTRPFGAEYLPSLEQAKVAVLPGGYNSLTDILYCQTPALILQRQMEDKEQNLHLQSLVAHQKGLLTPLPMNQVTPETLSTHIFHLLHQTTAPETTTRINLDGAEQSAHFLIQQANALTDSHIGSHLE